MRLVNDLIIEFIKKKKSQKKERQISYSRQTRAPGDLQGGGGACAEGNGFQVTLKLDPGGGWGGDSGVPAYLQRWGWKEVRAGHDRQGKPDAHSSEREGRTFLREGGSAPAPEGR